MKYDKNQSTGIRSDRIMTPLEIQTAAFNKKAVEDAAKHRAESSPGFLEWLLIGIAIAMVIIAFIRY